MKKNQSILILLFILSACETYVDSFELEDRPSKTVINAILSDNNSNTLMVDISKSIQFNGNNTRGDVQPATSSLKMFKNGVELTNMDVQNHSYTVPGVTAVAGTVYKLEAQANDIPAVTAEVTIPETPSIVLTDTVLIIGAGSVNCPDCQNDYVEATFSIENLNQTGYYSFEILNSISSEQGISFTTNTALMDFYFDGYGYWTGNSENESSLNRFYFSNKNANTHFINVTVRISRYLIPKNSRLIFKLNVYDYHYYEHMRTYAIYDESLGNPLVEKVRIHSNVENGLGLFGVNLVDLINADLSTFAYDFE